jgi:hypothetical protein
MKKIPPPSVPSKTFPPNLDYRYFENRQHCPFQQDATSFSLVNAWWLAEAILLIYANEVDIRKALQATNLTGAGFEMTFFEHNQHSAGSYITTISFCLPFEGPKLIIFGVR